MLKGKPLQYQTEKINIFFVDNILKPIDYIWSFDVYLHWLQFNIFCDVFIDYFQVFFATFEFTFSGWSSKTWVELKILFVVLQKELRLRSLKDTEYAYDVTGFLTIHLTLPAILTFTAICFASKLILL